MRVALIAIVVALTASARAQPNQRTDVVKASDPFPPIARNEPGAPIENDDDDLAEEIAARLDAPPVATVISAAVRAAGLHHDPGASVVRRARLAGLLPWLTVRAGTHTSWQEQAAADIGRGTTYEARATWRLDRLVFDGRELQVAAMTASRRRERRRLASRVIKSYFTWRRAMMARSSTRADEAAAELDALTNGWFTEMRRTASETRTSCGRHSLTP